MTSLAAHESGTLRLRETRRPAGIPGDRIQGGPMPVRAEKPVQGSDQQSCHPSRLTVMITGHVPAVRLPPDHAGRRMAAAVTA